jgi:hypothetical protein
MCYTESRKAPRGGHGKRKDEGGLPMKITKKNGNVVVYDDEKVINSILKANAGIQGEEISRKKAAVLADDVFTRVTDQHDVIRTQDVRDCTAAVLREKGYPKTAENYLNYKR